MLIKLTLASTRGPLYVRAGDVKQVQKDTENPLVTGVWTGLMQSGAGGAQPAFFAVLESPEEVAELVNTGWAKMRGLTEEVPLPGERRIKT